MWSLFSVLIVCIAEQSIYATTMQALGGVGGVGAVGGVAAGGGVRFVGGDIVKEVRNVCERSEWPWPVVTIEPDESSSSSNFRGWLRLGNVAVSASGRTKKDVGIFLHRYLYDLFEQGTIVFKFNPNCWWDCCGSSECSSPSSHPLLQLKPRKNKPGGKKCNEGKYSKFVEKLDIHVLRECPDCKYMNFVEYPSCLKCHMIFKEGEGDEVTVIFFDVERADGSGSSDAINIGAVKFSYKEKRVVGTFNSFVWTDGQINRFGTLHKHHIKKANGRMFKNDKQVSHDVPKTALENFDKFLSGSKFAVCHDSVDYQTINGMIDRNAVNAPSYKAIVKRDSQDFFKFIMRNEHQTMKYNLQLLVETFGDEQCRQLFNDDAHGALTDAVALCNVSTGHLHQRFKDWLLLSRLSTAAEDHHSSSLALSSGTDLQYRRPTLSVLPA